MTQTRKNQDRDHATSSGEDDRGLSGGLSGGLGGEMEVGGRHNSAVGLLESAIEPLVEDLGYELVLLEWLGSGKHRVMRLYLDSPAGVTVGDCTRVGRVLSNALDAQETAPETAPELGTETEVQAAPPRDPALAALLGKPYTLEVSSPGVDRPLTRRRHFADQVGGRVKLETYAPLEP